MNTLLRIFFLTATLLLCSGSLLADRIKDLASVEGVRSNSLLGYGLVVGLDGTGDQSAQTPFTTQAFISMLKQLGVTVPPDVKMQLKNIAAVSVQADLPAFARPGQTLDVNVTSIGNAKSLRGGTLLMTPLKAVDGQIYAIAQGSVVVSGFGAEGTDGSKIKVNQSNNGSVPGGAKVEKAVDSGFENNPALTLQLNRSDFTTAKRIADSINDVFGPGVARALDAGAVHVDAPADSNSKVTFLSMLENLEIDPGEEAARVVINSRTGTIVVGNKVKVSPVAVTHGSLTVTVSEDMQVSQPNAGALGGGTGQTVVVPKSKVSVDEEKKPMFLFPNQTSLEDIVKAVNQVGAAPGDLMAILEAMKRAGALKAELIVI